MATIQVKLRIFDNATASDSVVATITDATPEKCLECFNEVRIAYRHKGDFGVFFTNTDTDGGDFITDWCFDEETFKKRMALVINAVPNMVPSLKRY